MIEKLIPFAEAALACLMLAGGLAIVVAWCVATLVLGVVVVVADRFLPALSVRTSVADQQRSKA